MILITSKLASRPVHNRASTLAPIFNPQSSSVEQDLKTNGLEIFRKNLVEKGISKTAANLISNFRRSGTAANYQSAEKKWVSWVMNYRLIQLHAV